MSDDLLEPCENCVGGIVQRGDIAGNKCHQCVDGYMLSPMGYVLFYLMERQRKEQSA